MTSPRRATGGTKFIGTRVAITGVVAGGFVLSFGALAAGMGAEPWSPAPALEAPPVQLVVTQDGTVMVVSAEAAATMAAEGAAVVLEATVTASADGQAVVTTPQGPVIVQATLPPAPTAPPPPQPSVATAPPKPVATAAPRTSRGS